MAEVKRLLPVPNGDGEDVEVSRTLSIKNARDSTGTGNYSYSYVISDVEMEDIGQKNVRQWKRHSSVPNYGERLNSTFMRGLCEPTEADDVGKVSCPRKFSSGG